MKCYRPFRQPRIISFDLDDTLYDNHPYIVKANDALGEYLVTALDHIELTSADFAHARQQALTEHPNMSSDVALTRRRALFHLVVAAGKSPKEAEQIADEGYEIFYFHRSNFRVDEAVLSALASLQPHFRLFGITNGNANVEKLGLDTVLETTLHASIDHRAKPFPDMFHKVCDIAKVAPYELLHVGDGLVNDVYGAINAGAQAAWHACNRPMNLNKEPVLELPHCILDQLSDLLQLVQSDRND